jgi:hypothetical protein
MKYIYVVLFGNPSPFKESPQMISFYLFMCLLCYVTNINFHKTITNILVSIIIIIIIIIIIF